MEVETLLPKKLDKGDASYKAVEELDENLILLRMTLENGNDIASEQMLCKITKKLWKSIYCKFLIL